VAVLPLRRAGVTALALTTACGGLLTLPKDDTGTGAGGVNDAGPDVADEPIVPSGDRNRDVLDTTLEVDISAHTAVATITLAPSPSTGASFEIGDLDIRAVRQMSTPLPWIDRGSWLDVGVPASTAPLAITIEYSWHWHSVFDGVSAAGYTFTWPNKCGNVFPCRSEPSDGTTFHLKVGGAEAGRIIYPETIASEAPPYMAAWIAGDYVDIGLGKTEAGTRVVVRSLPSVIDAAKSGTAHLVVAFSWLEKTIGPYRFGSTVGPVAAPWTGKAFGGMEHHPFWHVYTLSMGDESVHIHEAAHGWFGNGVRLRCWEDYALSEGTVSYLVLRAMEAATDKATANVVLRSYITELFQMQADGMPHVAWPGSCGQNDILKDGLYTRAPYVRGALFYERLEARIGRAKLDLALHTFYQRWAGKAAGMQDMLDVVKEVSGYDPQACAKTWLIDPAVPSYTNCP